MSKLSPALKALINAPFARPGPAPAPPGVAAVYEAIARDAAAARLGPRPWLALSAAATFTLNSPAALAELHRVAAAEWDAVAAAELMRDVGLKCISFNGIPRVINCLVALRAALPPETAAQLGRTATRHVADFARARRRGDGLWDSVYAPLAGKLRAKLAAAHPDLPVHILDGHYALLLADPPGAGPGRVLTSVVAIACLRAQTGVGPQLLSHVYGLRRAWDDGTWDDGGVGEEARWLATDDGSAWVLRSVDAIVGLRG